MTQPSLFWPAEGITIGMGQVGRDGRVEGSLTCRIRCQSKSWNFARHIELSRRSNCVASGFKTSFEICDIWKSSGKGAAVRQNDILWLGRRSFRVQLHSWSSTPTTYASNGWTCYVWITASGWSQCT